MTADRDYRDFLDDLVNACRSIIDFVEGMSFDAYLADEKTRFAVMRGYEILGEARAAAIPVKRSRTFLNWKSNAVQYIACSDLHGGSPSITGLHQLPLLRIG